MPVRLRVRHLDAPPALGGWTLEPEAEVRARSSGMLKRGRPERLSSSKRETSCTERTR